MPNVSISIDYFPSVPFPRLALRRPSDVFLGFLVAPFPLPYLLLAEPSCLEPLCPLLLPSLAIAVCFDSVAPFVAFV